MNGMVMQLSTLNIKYEYRVESLSLDIIREEGFLEAVLNAKAVEGWMYVNSPSPGVLVFEREIPSEAS